MFQVPSSIVSTSKFHCYLSQVPTSIVPTSKFQIPNAKFLIPGSRFQVPSYHVPSATGPCNQFNYTMMPGSRFLCTAPVCPSRKYPGRHLDGDSCPAKPTCVIKLNGMFVGAQARHLAGFYDLINFRARGNWRHPGPGPPKGSKVISPNNKTQCRTRCRPLETLKLPLVSRSR